jgi:hypothetical protein
MDLRKTRHFTSLGAFAKLRNATVSFVVSVGLSVRLHKTLGFRWAGIPKI